MRFAIAWISVGLALAFSFGGPQALTGGPQAPQAEPPLEIEVLMRRLASTEGVVAEFRQVKELALLQVPIESRGTMIFIPPRCLAWETTSPGTSRLVIEGQSVRFHDATSAQDVDLSQDLIARGFVESFVVLWSGDYEAMKKQYEVDFRSEKDGWRLVLTPRAARMREFITRIELQGTSGPPERMVLHEAGGDRTTTTFGPIEVDHRFTPEELDETFSSPTACGRS